MFKTDKDKIASILAKNCYSNHLTMAVMTAIEIAEKQLNSGQDNTDIVREYGTISTGILADNDSPLAGLGLKRV